MFLLKSCDFQFLFAHRMRMKCVCKKDLYAIILLENWNYPSKTATTEAYFYSTSYVTAIPIQWKSQSITSVYWRYKVKEKKKNVRQHIAERKSKLFFISWFYRSRLEYDFHFYDGKMFWIYVMQFISLRICPIKYKWWHEHEAY